LQAQLLGRQRSGGWWFEASSGKKLARPILISKSAVVVHACDPRYVAGVVTRIMG
jgi:hypothetical protein